MGGNPSSESLAKGRGIGVGAWIRVFRNDLDHHGSSHPGDPDFPKIPGYCSGRIFRWVWKTCVVMETNAAAVGAEPRPASIAGGDQFKEPGEALV